MKNYLLYLFIISSCYLNAVAQDVNGVWTGNFIQYIHNTYDVEMRIEKLSPGNIFSAKLRITDGYYFGEYNVSGFICNQKFLEITTIVLIKENQTGNWVDCLNGTFDLNDDETELTFTDTWLNQDQKNNACKVKYIQKDMFQCLRSAYLHKAKYLEEVAEFDKMWNENTQKPTKDSMKVAPKTETKLVAKNEDRAPVIDTAKSVKQRPVYVKDEIEVSSKDITIEYWDRYNEDGDSISLYLNNKPVLENALLTKIKKSFTIHLDEKVNYLVLHAINTGTEPPNTASVTVKDGKKIQNVSLTSNLRTSGALKITLKE